MRCCVVLSFLLARALPAREILQWPCDQAAARPLRVARITTESVGRSASRRPQQLAPAPPLPPRHPPRLAGVLSLGAPLQRSIDRSLAVLCSIPFSLDSSSTRPSLDPLTRVLEDDWRARLSSDDRVLECSPWSLHRAAAAVSGALLCPDSIASHPGSAEAQPLLQHPRSSRWTLSQGQSGWIALASGAATAIMHGLDAKSESGALASERRLC